jgi:hypothetical protein
VLGPSENETEPCRNIQKVMENYTRIDHDRRRFRSYDVESHVVHDGVTCCDTLQEIEKGLGAFPIEKL